MKREKSFLNTGIGLTVLAGFFWAGLMGSSSAQQPTPQQEQARKQKMAEDARAAALRRAEKRAGVAQGKPGTPAAAQPTSLPAMLPPVNPQRAVQRAQAPQPTPVTPPVPAPVTPGTPMPQPPAVQPTIANTPPVNTTPMPQPPLTPQAQQPQPLAAQASPPAAGASTPTPPTSSPSLTEELAKQERGEVPTLQTDPAATQPEVAPAEVQKFESASDEVLEEKARKARYSAFAGARNRLAAAGAPGSVQPVAAQPGAIAPQPAAVPNAPQAGVAQPGFPAPGFQPATVAPAAPGAPVAPGAPAAPGGIVINPATGTPEIKPNTFWQLPAEERPYFFSWKDTPFEKACQDLVEMTGLSLMGMATIDPGMKARPMTFQSNKLLSYDEALTRFNELILEMNLWVVRRENFLVIKPLTEWYQHIPPERRFMSLEDYRKAKLPLWELASLVVEPKHRPVEILANGAMDVVPFNTARITAVPGTNKLEIKGFVYYIEQQLKFIEKNEIPNLDDGRYWAEYKLEFATSSDAVLILETMVGAVSDVAMQPGQPQMPRHMRGQPQQPQPQPQPGQITDMVPPSTTEQIDIQEDARRNCILVHATKPNHEKVKEYIAKYIDLALNPGEKTKMFKLQHADPSTVADIIRSLLGERQFVQQFQPGQQPQPQPQPMPNRRGGGMQQQPGMVVNVGTTSVITTVPSLKSLLVKANSDEMLFIEKYIKELDVPSEANSYLFVALKYANGNVVANMLTNTLGNRQVQGNPGEQIFRAVSDPQNERGVVITGEPVDLADARKLIEQLDVDPDLGTVERMIRLENTVPAILADILTNRYNGQSRGNSSGLPRFIGDEASQSLIIVCQEEMWPDIERLVKEIDTESKTLRFPKTYRIKYAQSQALSSVLSQSFNPTNGGIDQPGTPKFQYEHQSNMLVVMATDEMHERVAKLIAELDQPGPGDDALLQPIELIHADANYVASKIESLFQKRVQNNRGNQMRVPINIVAESISNRVLISASPEDLKEAEAIAKQIDKDYEARKFVRKTFHVTNISGAEIESMLRVMFPSDHRSDADMAGGVRIGQAGDDIIAFAPEEKMKQIENLILELDKDPNQGNEMRTYTLKSIDSSGTAGLAQNLDQLFNPGKSSGKGSSNIRFIGESNSNLLIVSAPSPKMAAIDEKIQEIIKSSDSKDLTLVIQHLDVQQGSPQEIAEMVQPLLTAKYEELQSQKGGGRPASTAPQIVAHPAAKRLIVSAPESLMVLAKELVTEFDRPATPSTLRIVALEKAKAADLAPVIEQMVEKKAVSGGGGGGFRSQNRPWYKAANNSENETLDVTSVASSNSLILRGPEGKVQAAEELAKTLDKDSHPEGPMFKVIEIKEADVFDVVSMIEEMVGGGASDADDSHVTVGAGSVIVKSDLFSNKIFISAPREKFPMIEQIISLKEGMALAAKEAPEQAGKIGSLVSASRGEITKSYDVTGPVDDIAKNLDNVLVSLIGYFDAPYVKSFPFANQIIVTGKPSQFKMVEEWLEKLQKNPVKPRVVMLARRVPIEMAGRVAETLANNAPKGVSVNVAALPNTKRDPKAALKAIRKQEIQWDDPVITTQPAPAAATFVPPAILDDMQTALSSLQYLAEAQVTTQPAAETQPAVATQPAAATTQPAAAPAPVPAPEAAPTPAPAPQAAAPMPATAAPAATTPAAEAVAAAPTNPIAAAALEALAKGQVQIRYDENSGSIYMIGEEPQVEQLKDVLETLVEEADKLAEEGEERPIRVFTLNHVDVNIAAAILEQMFNERSNRQGQQQPQPGQAAQPPQPQPQAPKPEGEDKSDKEEEGGKKGKSSRRQREKEESKKDSDAPRGEGGGERIRVFPDTRMQTLVIRADEKDFPLIAELVLKIDRPTDRPPVDIRIFEIKKLNAFDVEQAIKAILKIDDGTGGGFRRGGRRGMNQGGFGGNMDQQAMMMDQLQQQMMELQAGTMGVEGQPQVPGQEGQGNKMKLNPTKEISITSDATTNTVIVSAPPEGLQLVEKLIDKLEAQESPVQIVTLVLKHADAEKVATEVERVFAGSGRRGGSGGRGQGDGGGGGGGGGGGNASRVGQDLRIAADARTNTVVIRALGADMPKIQGIIEKLDTSTQEGQVQLYGIEHANATEMATTLSKIFVTDDNVKGPLAVKISADADTNSLIVSAPPTQQIMIGVKVIELDKRVGANLEPRQIQLGIASASSVAIKLQTIFVPKGPGSRSGNQRITIEGDDNSGLIFVTAPPEMFKTIESTAKQLDTATRQDIRVFKLTNAFATDVHVMFKDMMTQLIAQLKGTGGVDPFTVTPDARTNSLIVSGSPAIFLLVDKVLKDIDVTPTDILTTAMVGITKGSAVSIAASINSLYTGPKAAPPPGNVPPPTAVAEPNANVVYIYGTKAQIDQIKASIIDPLENYKAPLDTLIKDYQIPVQYAKVEDVAKILTDYFALRNSKMSQANSVSVPPADLAIAIVADPSTRQLYVTANERNKALIDILLKTADVPSATASARQTKVFPLQFADPSYTTTAITTAFGREGNVSESEQVKVVAELGTNSIVVSASPENMKLIEEMLLNLDKPSGTTARRTTPIEVAKADPQDVATAVNDIYSRDRTRTGHSAVLATVPRGSNQVLVTCANAQLAEVTALVKQLDVDPGTQTAPKVIKIENASAAVVAQTLTRIFSDPSVPRRGAHDVIPLIMADDTTNSLVVRAGKVDYNLIEEMAHKLDTKTSGPSGIDVVPVSRGVDVRLLAKEIENTINQGERYKVAQQPTYRAGQIAVGVDERGPNLMVAGSPELFDTVRNLVKQLDTAPPSRETKTMIIPVKNIPPADMKRILDQMINQHKGRQARP